MFILHSSYCIRWSRREMLYILRSHNLLFSRPLDVSIYYYYYFRCPMYYNYYLLGLRGLNSNLALIDESSGTISWYKSLDPPPTFSSARHQTPAVHYMTDIVIYYLCFLLLSWVLVIVFFSREWSLPWLKKVCLLSRPAPTTTTWAPLATLCPPKVMIAKSGSTED